MNPRCRQLVAHTFRKRRNFAIAVLSEVAAPLLRGCARIRCQQAPSPPEQWQRGVLLGANHIGDVLYCTASLMFLKKRFPKCEWHFVAPPPASEVLANNPYIASCVPTLESLHPEAPIDVAICYNTGGYWRELIQAAKLGIPNRVSYTHKGFSGLVTSRVHINYPQPYPAYFRDLVAQLTGFVPDWPLRPVLHCTEEDERAAELFHQQLQLNGRPLIACFATSRQKAGVWPAAQIALLLRKIHNIVDCRSILFGAVSDEPQLLALRSKYSLPSLVYAGALNLRALTCFLKYAAVAISPDSGPRHMANAANVPVFFVRNLAVRKIETGSYLETEHDLAPEVECVPPSKQSACFASIDPDAVAEEIGHFIATTL